MNYISMLLNDIKPQPEHTPEELALVKRVPSGILTKGELQMYPTKQFLNSVARGSQSPNRLAKYRLSKLRGKVNDS